MGRGARAALSFCCLLTSVVIAWGLAGAVQAAPVTVLMTGQWSSVTDSAGVLDGSITAGGSFSVTIVYDDAAFDLDPDPAVGGYIFPVATSDFTITSGSYTFAAGSDLIIGIENDHNGDDVLAIFSDQYSILGPLPGGVSVATPAYVNPFFSDPTESAHSSDLLTDLPWDLSAYSLRDFYLFLAINDGSGPLEYVELISNSVSATILPEPGLLPLLALGAFSLGARRSARP